MAGVDQKGLLKSVLHDPRGDGVHLDVEGGKLEGEDFREHLEAGLGDPVYPHSRRGLGPGKGRDADDLPPLLLPHDPGGFARAEESAGEISLDDLVPDGEVRIDNGGGQQIHPDIVDEEIEAPETADGRVEQVLHIPFAGDMGRQGIQPLTAAECIHGGREIFLLPAADDDLRSLGEEAPGQFQTDPPASSRHDDYLFLQTICNAVHRFPPERILPAGSRRRFGTRNRCDLPKRTTINHRRN